jgi:hypothetical protein
LRFAAFLALWGVWPMDYSPDEKFNSGHLKHEKFTSRISAGRHSTGEQQVVGVMAEVTSGFCSA